MSSKNSVQSDLEKLEPLQKPVKRLLTPFLSKKVPPLPNKAERKSIPIFKANIVSRIFFFWLIPLLNKGYKRTLVQNDLWILDESLTLKTAYSKFQIALNSIVEKHKLKNPSSLKYPRYSVFFAIIKSMKWEYSAAIILKCISSAASAFTPWVMKYLVTFIERKAANPETPDNAGIGYAFAISLMLILFGLLKNQALLLSKLVGAQSRTILTKALLEKSLTANTESKNKFPKGKIVSLMGADLERVDEALTFLPDIVSAPIPMIIGIVILIVNLRVSALAGIAVFFFLLVLMAVPTLILFRYRSKANKFADKRISITREILLAMKMIKLYSWEDAYENVISDIRAKEIGYVFKFQVIMSYMVAIVIAAPGITSLVAFLVSYAISGKGDAATIFSSLSLFAMLSTQIIEIPSSLSFCAQGFTSMIRVTRFLESQDEEKLSEFFYDNSIIDDDKTAIKIINGSFCWDIYEKEKNSEIEEDPEDDNKLEKEVVLKHSTLEIFSDLNLSVKKGEFIVVVGPIGCGKSSLLSAIYGTMTKTKGSIGIDGSIIFCDSPWIQNATVRDNIVFGLEFDSARYQQTIKCCCLQDDLDQFSYGDLTEIGERGVTLSGGQKARLSLARAVYADRDIYLLDDVLSAVDANVGKHVVDYCLMDMIVQKTRILVTHQLSLVEKADRVIFLNSSGIVDLGTEDELRERNQEFAKLMTLNVQGSTTLAKVETEKLADDTKESTTVKDAFQSLYDEEERAFNSIPLSLYYTYITNGVGIFGRFAFPLLFVVIILSVFILLFANVWLSFWIGEKFKSVRDPVYIGIYILLTFVSIAFVTAEFALLGYFTTESSRVLNVKSIKRVLHTPMSFMDVTPIGRVLNRFTKDTNALDNEVGTQLELFIHTTSYMIGVLILAVIYIPWFAIALPILVAMFVGVTNYYQASSREVKRLEAINKSFILNNFNEVLGGLSTIKSYDAQSRFLDVNDEFCDKMNEVYFIVNANQRWIGVNLDTLAGIVVLLVSLLTTTGQFNLSASSAGLLTNYLISFAQSLSSIVENFSDLENEMNSVERVCHYAFNLEQEAPYMISETTPPPNWPSQGSIGFNNVSLRYRDGLPLILKNLSFQADGGAKIGICGRTGAGKSSLMTALCRIVELSSGSIEIDSVDISKLGLHQLREKLSIIPQDPVLFEGDLRSNLDPFNEHDEDKLWDALGRCGILTQDTLKEIKQQTGDYHKFHLLSRVEEEGSNFSLGERQLIALARALVRDSKILIMDEATSNVDYETDELVQTTIAKEFKDCTILCVAHRLRTILKYDKILVLDKGELKEYDEPLKLFQKGGFFSQMCHSSRISESDFVH